MEIETIKKAVEEELSKEGYSLYQLTFIPSTAEGPKLEIIVDKEEAISLNDIVKVSESLSALLDELDPIEGGYTLDVSSLGAEKPLKVEELPSKVGKYVCLTLSNPFKGENLLTGEITASSEDSITLKINLKGKISNLEIALNSIIKANLAVKI